MNKVIIALASLMSVSTFAAGYECTTIADQGKYTVRANVGGALREGKTAVVVLSNNDVNEGRKTIARLYGNVQEYTVRGETQYTRVGAPVTKEVRGGEYILGTRMSQVSFVVLNVSGSEDSATRMGSLVLRKKDGSQTRASLRCYEN